MSTSSTVHSETLAQIGEIMEPMGRAALDAARVLAQTSAVFVAKAKNFRVVEHHRA